jgi:hypothetical protein
VCEGCVCEVVCVRVCRWVCVCEGCVCVCVCVCDTDTGRQAKPAKRRTVRRHQYTQTRLFSHVHK